MAEETTPAGQGNPPAVPVGGQDGGQPAGKGEGESLYQMPDGRELSGEQVLEEYKNLQTDYTKKATLLAELTKPKEVTQDPWKDPSYSPQSWDEVLGAAEQRVLAKIKSEQEVLSQQQAQETADRQKISDEVDKSVAEIKKTDKELNEDDMFTFAAEKAKKGVQYTTVDSLYEDYKMIREARKQGQQDALRNMANRQNLNMGSAGPQGPAPVNLADLRKHSSIIDAVRERLSSG